MEEATETTVTVTRRITEASREAARRNGRKSVEALKRPEHIAARSAGQKARWAKWRADRGI